MWELDLYSFVPVFDSQTGDRYATLAFKGSTARQNEVDDIIRCYRDDAMMSDWNINDVVEALRSKGYQVSIVKDDEPHITPLYI